MIIPAISNNISNKCNFKSSEKPQSYNEALESIFKNDDKKDNTNAMIGFGILAVLLSFFAAIQIHSAKKLEKLISKFDEKIQPELKKALKDYHFDDREKLMTGVWESFAKSMKTTEEVKSSVISVAKAKQIKTISEETFGEKAWRLLDCL